MPAPDEAISLESDALHVRCTPAHGFSIAALVDRRSGVDALWTRPGVTPAPGSRSLGPPGEPSEATFLERFAGGWFEMFPEVGYTLPGDPASFVHGEVVRLPWELLDAGPAHAEARVQAVHRPLRLTRRLAVDGPMLHVSERIENVGAEPARYTWGHHPCFSRAAFAGGRIAIDVADAAVPEPWFDPEHAILRPGSLTWPAAARRTGPAAVDLAEIPAEPDGRHDHTCLRVAAGAIGLSSPRAGRTLRIAFDAGRFPHVLLWQNFRAGGGPPFFGAADTFALEWSTSPGRSTPDALAAGPLPELHPGAAVETAIEVRWE